MDQHAALLLTDLVDSAALAQRLGDEAMGRLWAAHDRVARDLLRQWQGREIDKTDGFLILFTEARSALGYALAYHRALAALEPTLRAADGQPVRLRARAGLHVGQVSIRETPAADVALGAKPLEVDGVTKPLAARVMSTALGGQTLITLPAKAALGDIPQRVVSHGHWAVKGLPVPVELFEVGEEGAPFTAPPDADKVYRVVRQGSTEGDSGTDSDSGIWLPLREARHSLPAERDAFVGRRSTLAELSRRFDEGARLVSLLGIGGCGKTRVAMRFGWTRLGDFPGGVWFCDLAGARTPEGLFSAVAQGLDVPLGPEDPLQQLGNALAGRGACLVVLDNFEQLARHAEATLGRWLERAGAARFLVTSREVLGIAGEEAVFLAPMVADDAQVLFLRRAAAARRDFQPSADDLAATAPLVQLLDGLPLAIELAAARVRTLPPRALLARMSERFKLLASSGGRLDRQATLRATFDWSWDLLSPAEKSALAQLAVFHGSFALDAAEAVIDLSPFADAPWPLDVVQSLVDKSFVRALPQERFGLLGSVQAYALERLQAQDDALGTGPQAWKAAQQRHGGHYAALGPTRATEQQAADLDNLVAATLWAVHAQQGELASGALAGAWAALALRGPFKTAIDLAEATCALQPLAASAAARAFTVLGQSLTAAGRRAEAAPAFETALQHAQAAGDQASESSARSSLAALLARQGRAAEAQAQHEEALRLARVAGDPALACAALNGLGALHFSQGHMGLARQHWEDVLQRARQAGLTRWQCQVLGNLSSLDANLGRPAESLRQGEAALVLARQLGDRQREGNTLCNLGLLYVMQGQLAAALDAGQAALQVARDLGDARLECVAQCNLGLVHKAQREPAQALARFDAALVLSRQTRDRRSEGQILGYLGLAQAQLGEHTAAQQQLAAGQAILEALQDPLSLGLLLCCRAESQLLAGDAAAAHQAQLQAQALAAQAGAGPESELGLALAQLQQAQTLAPQAS